jgi:hypothetical protein
MCFFKKKDFVPKLKVGDILVDKDKIGGDPFDKTANDFIIIEEFAYNEVNVLYVKFRYMNRVGQKSLVSYSLKYNTIIYGFKLINPDILNKMSINI